MIQVISKLLTLFLNAALSLTLGGEAIRLWEYEFVTFEDILKGQFEGIHLFSGYYEAAPLTSILSFVGQILILSSFLTKKMKNKLIKVGIVFLWIGLFNLLIRSQGSLFFLSLLSSLLFILSSAWTFWISNSKNSFQQNNGA